MAAASYWRMTKRAVSDFFEDDAMTYAASLAFYTALSLAPLLLLLITIGGFLGESTQQDLITQLEQMVGGKAAEGIEMIIDNAQQNPQQSTWALVVSLAVLLFSASGVFAQLQAALNHIWDVKPKPGAGVWGWIRKRLLSIGMIFAILFILLVSLVLSAAIGAILQAMGLSTSGGNADWIGRIITFIISLLVFIVLFALIYKYLPDVRIEWRYVWTGAIFTAVLFAVGKLLIGLYLSTAGVGSSYGAAGSLIALLVWVYYSSLILFFGAELTQAYAHMQGASLLPDRHAVRDETAAAKREQRDQA